MEVFATLLSRGVHPGVDPEHAPFEHGGAPLRKVELACRRCGGPLALFFRIVSGQPN